MTAPAWESPLPADLMLRGGNPDLLRDELIEIIAADIEAQPRSLQKRIGPSELGSPCARKVGYGLMEAPVMNRNRPPTWKAYVGTAIHAILEKAFDQHNLAHAPELDYNERWFIESTVDVGEIGGRPVTGHCDLYDRLTCTVVDWKTCSPARLKAFRASGPSPTYRAQAHLYGRGWARRGMPVDTVMIVFLPRNGELHEAHAWHERYDEAIAVQALRRADLIQTVVDTRGVQGLGLLPVAEDYCTSCDWFVPDAVDVRFGCQGQRERVEPAPALTLGGRL